MCLHEKATAVHASPGLQRSERVERVRMSNSRAQTSRMSRWHVLDIFKSHKSKLANNVISAEINIEKASRPKKLSKTPTISSYRSS